MFHKILFAAVVACVVGMGVILHRFSDTTDLLKKYQKFGFVASDFQYEKTEKTWGEGIVFYQVSFPFMPVPMRADQMTLSLSDSGMFLQLKNAHLQVTDGLNKIYGQNIAQYLDTYQPYRHFFNRLLTSMAVMGMDDFTADITITTTYHTDKEMRFTVDMTQEKLPVLQMNGMIHIPLVGAHQFSDLWMGHIASIDAVLAEALFTRYLYYAESRQTSVPEFVKRDTFRITGQSLAPFKNSLQ